jgi:hypothetical protein
VFLVTETTLNCGFVGTLVALLLVSTRRTCWFPTFTFLNVVLPPGFTTLPPRLVNCSSVVELSNALEGATAVNSTWLGSLFRTSIEPLPFVFPPPLAKANDGATVTNSATKQNLYMGNSLKAKSVLMWDVGNLAGVFMTKQLTCPTSPSLFLSAYPKITDSARGKRRRITVFG